jgi:hypothetical protein
LPHLLRQHSGDGVDHQKAAEKERQEAQHAQDEEDGIRDVGGGVPAGVGGHRNGGDGASALFNLVADAVGYLGDVRPVEAVALNHKAQLAEVAGQPQPFHGVQSNVSHDLRLQNGRHARRVVGRARHVELQLAVVRGLHGQAVAHGKAKVG